VFNCHVRVLPWLEKEINNFLQKSVDSPSALWQTWRMTTKIEIPPMVESQCWKVGDELFMDRHKALVERFLRCSFLQAVWETVWKGRGVPLPLAICLAARALFEGDNPS